MYPTKPLWKICEILLWWTPPRNDKKNFWWDFLWCSIRDMKTKYIFDTNEKLTDLWVKNSNVKLLKEWTLFMSFKLSLWKLAFAWKDLYTNEAIAWLPIKNENELDKEFLYYILSWYDFSVSWTDNSVKWATLNKAKLEKLPIPLPPLPTQKLIVQKLDSSFEKIDKSIEITKKNLENLEQLNKSILEEVFSEWEYKMKNLGELITLNYWKWVDKKDKDENWLYDVYWANWVMYKSNNFLFDWDSIIVWRKWSAWALNRVNWKFWASDVTYYVTVNWRNDLDYIYNWLKFLNIPSLAQWVKPWINRNQAYELKIPLPPLPKQKEIVAYLDKVFEKNKSLKNEYERKLKNLEELKQSLLKEAFDGRLV